MKFLRKEFINFHANRYRGSFGGVVQVLTGQPFDTIKVRLQSQGHLYTGTLDCIQKTIKNEGFSAFYKVK